MSYSDAADAAVSVSCKHTGQLIQDCLIRGASHPFFEYRRLWSLEDSFNKSQTRWRKMNSHKAVVRTMVSRLTTRRNVNPAAFGAALLLAASVAQAEPWLHLPLSGDDWIISQYFDHAPGPAVEDYRGSSVHLKNRHDGIDFAVPNFRWMDDPARHVYVLAVADGTVSSTRDGHPDRNTACRGDANFVWVDHPNGYRSGYFHMKRGSVAVAPGQAVKAGDRLGVVGSSGCSESPHLHFELKDGEGVDVDPFHENLWIKPPAYRVPFSLEDYVVNSRRLTEVAQLIDPLPNVTSVRADSTLGIGATLSGVRKGHRFQIVAQRGNTKVVKQTTFDSAYWHGSWGWNFDLGGGNWVISFFLNGRRAAQHRVAVR